MAKSSLWFRASKPNGCFPSSAFNTYRYPWISLRPVLEAENSGASLRKNRLKNSVSTSFSRPRGWHLNWINWINWINCQRWVFLVVAQSIQDASAACRAVVDFSPGIIVHRDTVHTWLILTYRVDMGGRVSWAQQTARSLRQNLQRPTRTSFLGAVAKLHSSRQRWIRTRGIQMDCSLTWIVFCLHFNSVAAS